MTLVLTDPYRPHINLSIRGTVWENPDGTWTGSVYVDTPGYSGIPKERVLATKAVAVEWVRLAANKERDRIEDIRQRLLLSDATKEEVDL